MGKIAERVKTKKSKTKVEPLRGSKEEKDKLAEAIEKEILEGAEARRRKTAKPATATLAGSLTAVSRFVQLGILIGEIMGKIKQQLLTKPIRWFTNYTGVLRHLHWYEIVSFCVVIFSFGFIAAVKLGAERFPNIGQYIGVAGAILSVSSAIFCISILMTGKKANT